MRTASVLAVGFFSFLLLLPTILIAQNETPTTPGVLRDIGGFRLHFVRAGSGSTSVVLIHGGGDASGVWKPVLNRIHSQATVIAIDSHGRGYSEWGHRIRTYRQIAADFRRLLELEGVEGPYLLVAHSLGAIIAQSFAKLYLDDVAGVVLVDPTPLDRLGRRERDDGSHYLARDRDFARPLAVPRVLGPGTTVAAATEAFTRTNDYTRFESFLTRKEVAELEASTNHARLRPEGAELSPFWSEELRDLYDSRKPHWLGDRPLRLLYVAADYADYPDDWFSTETFTKESAARAEEASLMRYLEDSTDSRAILVESGHHIQIEKADIVASVIRKTIAIVERRKPTREGRR